MHQSDMQPVPAALVGPFTGALVGLHQWINVDDAEPMNRALWTLAVPASTVLEATHSMMALADSTAAMSALEALHSTLATVIAAESADAVIASILDVMLRMMLLGVVEPYLAS